MISKNLSSMTWVGNLYEKFEAMCLEVEENMYEDTIKYMENQVQTVGASVKRFYSDVIQDLTPSAVDPVKTQRVKSSKLVHTDEARDLSPSPVDLHSGLSEEQHDDFGICESQKAGVNEAFFEADFQKRTRVSNETVSMIKDAGNPLSLASVCDSRYQSPLPITECVKENCPNVDLGKDDHDRVVHKKFVRMKETSCTERSPLSKASCVVDPIPGDSNTDTSHCKNPEVAEEQVDKILPLAAVEIKECVSEGGTFSRVGCRVKGTINDEILITFAEDTGAEKRHPFNGGLSDELGTSGNDIMTSVARSSEDFLHLIHHPGRLDYLSVDGIERETGGTIAPLDEIKEEDNCIVVDASKSYIVPQRKVKNRSYKKKIRDAFTAKKSAREQEYEQLAVKHTETATAADERSAEKIIQMLSADPHEENLPDQDLFESEWELL